MLSLLKEMLNDYSSSLYLSRETFSQSLRRSKTAIASRMMYESIQATPLSQLSIRLSVGLSELTSEQWYDKFRSSLGCLDWLLGLARSALVFVEVVAECISVKALSGRSQMELT